MNPSNVQTTAECAKCGATRPLDIANSSPRPACPECGATAVSFGVSAVIQLSTEVSVSASLEPGDQSLGWTRRWERTQSRLPALLAPHTEHLTGEAIKEARDDLFAFFMQTYHIKDALKVEATSLGLDKKEIENAVNADPDLRLLGGLANLAKHHGKGRDADAPEIIRTCGTSGDTGGGWRLDVTIRRSGEDLDALQIARSAVDAWRGLLSGWGLI
jgi:hypothetical protein